MTTGETTNMLILGKKLHLSDQLPHQPFSEVSRLQHEFVIDKKKKLEQAH